MLKHQLHIYSGRIHIKLTYSARVLDGHHYCLQFLVFVLSGPESCVLIDWPIIEDTNIEQPVVLMACSLIHTDTERW